MPLAVAMMVTWVYAVTALVVMVNGRVLAQAGTRKVPVPWVSAGLLLVMVTVIWPGAAGHSSVTVPFTVLPPFTMTGLSVTDCTPIGRTISTAVTPPGYALIVTLVFA